MRECYINYRSITKAQRALRELTRRGVHAELVRTPKVLQENGCGYSLRLPERELARARPLPEGHGRVYVMHSGVWEEQAP